jgi:biotin transport system substrate-specific component
LATNTLERYRIARDHAWQWRVELGLTKKIALALGMAAIVGLLAQIRIPLTPVPITGQTLGVLLAGVLLGRWWGGISLGMYAGLGAAGLPWFTGWHGDVSALVGASGGYIYGFILAALFLGYFTDKYIRSRSFLVIFGLMLFANFVLIYVPGLIQLKIWLTLVKGQTVGLSQLLAMGLVPFIIGDLIKLACAAGITRVITTKQAFNGEEDKDKWANWRIP